MSCQIPQTCINESELEPISSWFEIKIPITFAASKK